MPLASLDYYGIFYFINCGGMMNKVKLTYVFNEINYCDPNCPYLTYDDTKSINIDCQITKKPLDFYYWFMANCIDEKPNDT